MFSSVFMVGAYLGLGLPASSPSPPSRIIGTSTAAGFSTKSKANSALAAASGQLTFSPWNLVTTNVGITKQNTKQSYAAMPANIKLAKRSEKGLLTPDNCGQAVDYASMMVHKAPASRKR